MLELPTACAVGGSDRVGGSGAGKDRWKCTAPERSRLARADKKPHSEPVARFTSCRDDALLAQKTPKVPSWWQPESQSRQPMLVLGGQQRRFWAPPLRGTDRETSERPLTRLLDSELPLCQHCPQGLGSSGERRTPTCLQGLVSQQDEDSNPWERHQQLKDPCVSGGRAGPNPADVRAPATAPQQDSQAKPGIFHTQKATRTGSERKKGSAEEVNAPEAVLLCCCGRSEGKLVDPPQRASLEPPSRPGGPAYSDSGWSCIVTAERPAQPPPDLHSACTLTTVPAVRREPHPDKQPHACSGLPQGCTGGLRSQ
ncbi:hypothetical protein CB1_000507009 [Camelus ferus]|nr:hypothetical protein CB1_000507009 [Camelus ferus]